MKKILKKIKLRTWVALGLLTILLPVLLLSLYRPAETQAEWFNDAWAYRQPWSFTHNAALSNQRVTFTISNTNTLVTNGKLQSDCDDIRFTDQSGKLLRIQLTGTCNSASTTYDVIIPSVLNGLNSGYLYYGNPGASTISEDISAFTSLSPSGGAPAFTTEERGEAPQLYLPMDEGYGTTTNDATSGANNGTITGSAWQAEDKCIAQKCLWFDGTDDVTTITQTARINLDGNLISGFTFSAWIRPNGVGEGTGGQIFYKGTNTWLRVDTLSSGNLDLQASVDLATTDATLNVSTAVPQNKWSHVALTYTDDGDDELTLWVNGKSVGSSTDGSGAPAADTNNLLVGGNTTNNFQGFIDEFKIYKQEKTTAQIQNDFASKGTNEGISARFGQQDTAFLNDGLVGYWPMNDNDIDSHSCALGGTGDVCDFSGNGFNGSDLGTMTDSDYVGGKFGSGLNFDGINDAVTTADIDYGTGNQITVSAWFKYTTCTGSDSQCYIVSKGQFHGSSAYNLTVTSVGLVSFVVQGTGAQIDNNYHDGLWHQAVGVLNGTATTLFIDGVLQATNTVSPSNNNDLIVIGGDDTDNTYRPFNGDIDEVRIYNRALSSAEVRSLYNWAPGPTAYWKMDENTATTVADSSGNGYNGTRTGSAWVTGKFGAGLLSDESGNDVVEVADNNAFDIGATDSFTIMGWVKINGDTQFSNPQPLVSHGNADAGTQAGFALVVRGLATTCNGASNNGTLVCLRVADGTDQYVVRSSTAVAANGVWHHIAATWDNSSETNTLIYIDGVADSVSRAGTFANIDSLSSAHAFCIGEDSNVTCDTDSHDFTLDEIKFYNYARTTQQIVEDMNGGHPSGGSPIASQVAYWAMDEQYGTTANNSNSAQASLTGSLSPAPTWRTKENCKLNGCLDFDGTDDVVTVTNATAIDLNDNLLNGFTFSAWVNPDTAGEGSVGQIFNKTTTTTTNCALSGSTPFSITCTLDLATDATVTVSSVLPASTWTHFALSYTDDADDEITVWIDGIARGTSTNGVGPTSADTSNLFIGNNPAGSATFDGKIDEFKVYSSELTAEQIKIDRNFGGVLSFGTGNDEASQISGGAGNAPVGYWDFNENTGTTGNDKSGNGNSAAIANGVWTSSGKYGAGLSSTINNVVESAIVTDPGSGILDFDNTQDFTASVWFKGTAVDGTPYLIFKGAASNSSAGYMLRVDSSTSVVYRYTDGDGVGNDGANPTVTNFFDNKWHNFMIVMDRNGSEFGTTGFHLLIDGLLVSSDTTLTEGSGVSTQNLVTADFDASNEMEGTVDELKIYNYARSRAQVAYDFNRGGPVAWWQMDECSGTTANDASGNGNTGTITPQSLDNTAAGTCTSGTATHMWNDGATGKFNASLGFDGDDDYVSITQTLGLPLYNSTTSSISLWAKNLNISQLDARLFSQGNVSSNNPLYTLGTGSGAGQGDQLRIFIRDDSNTILFNTVTSDEVINDNDWHHIVLVDNNGSVTLYIDGKARTLGTSSYTRGTLTIDRTSIAAVQRASVSNFFDGQIDDVRLFNYALSAAQVRKLYGNDSGARFGPAQGSP